MAETGTRPNILFCISDDQSYPHAGAYGCAWVETPAFDRVARDGILFSNAFTPNAKCAPSRAAILTGRYSWQLGEACNHFCNFPAEHPVFTETLRDAGYFVGYTGKGWAPGNPGKNPDGTPRQLTGKGFQKHKLKPPTTGIAPTDYAKNFAAFLDERPADTPFFFWYGGKEPHRNYQFRSGIEVGGKSPEQIDAVPPYWPDCEDVKADMLDYAFEIEWFDKHLGAMLDMLETRGLLENTLVLVTSDNGMPFPRIKAQQYEYSYHEPMAAMWPARIKPGRTVEDLVSFIDLAPTFLELAGLPLDPEISGRSLRDILESDDSGLVDRDRTVLFSGKERHDIGRPGNVGYPIRAIRNQQYLYLRNYEPDRWPAGDPETFYRAIDDSPTKTLLVEEMEKGNDSYWKLCMGRRPEEELYDIRNDPHCIENLAAQRPFAGLKKELREELEAALSHQGDPRMHGEGAVFDHYEYTNEREVALVAKMWKKVRANGGKLCFKSRSPRELRVE